MKKFTIVCLVVFVSLYLVGNVFAGEKEDCIALCEAAAKMFKEKGKDATIAEVNKKDGQFVKGSLYIFLQGMDGTMMGHPMKASLIGKNLIDLKDKAGKAFFKEFTEVAKKGSGWVDYKWPKPGEEKPSDKTSYILKVNDDIFVGAGFYK